MISRPRDDREVFSSGWKDVWNAWELRGMVLLSLSIQIFLICIGNCRKRSNGILLTILTWLGYLTADPVAIYALGIITNKLTRSSNPRIDMDIKLTVFWAPFLLLHLGGPDTITAYSLEDNQLWLRHLLTLLTQSGVTLYIFLMSWNGSNLSIMTIGMIFAGFLKYSERVWVLLTSSLEQFRDSIPHRPLNYSKVVEEQKLLEAEGFHVLPYEVIEVREAVLENTLQETNLFSDRHKTCLGQLLAAKGLFSIFQRLFVDLLLSFQDRDTSLAILKGKDAEFAFKVIEIELSLMFDMLYTKAKLIDTRWGIARRVAVMLFSAVVLVIFLTDEAHNSYSRVDLGMTFLLLVAAIFLEVYALTFIVLSDNMVCWLIKNKKYHILKLICRLQLLSVRRRWSGQLAQFSLLSFSLREKHLFCHKLLELLKIDDNIEKHLYKSKKDMTGELKDLIKDHFDGRESTWNNPGCRILNRKNKMNSLGWSIDLDFDQSILIWHIATELCLHPSNPDSLIPSSEDERIRNSIRSRCMTSRLLSRYLMYLLVFHPIMLPTGIGQLKFKDMYIEAMKFFDEQKSLSFEQKKSEGKCMASEALKSLCDHVITALRKTDKEGESKVWEACKQLRNNVKTKINLTIMKEDKSKFTLFNGCLLATKLEEEKDKEVRWEIISEVWVEMLAYAAIKCKGSYHCQQLRRGGELLTHVWLLMAHFGLSDHFKLPYASSIAGFMAR